jgi:hypothetical protein
MPWGKGEPRAHAQRPSPLGVRGDPKDHWVEKDEDQAAQYQERAQTLRENPRGILDDETQRELLRHTDECEAIAGKLPPVSQSARFDPDAQFA